MREKGTSSSSAGYYVIQESFTVIEDGEKNVNTIVHFIFVNTF